MCVSCIFFVGWELQGWKKLKGRDILKLKLVRVRLQETNNLFLGLNPSTLRVSLEAIVCYSPTFENNL